MKEEYYGCFANGQCWYYGYSIFDRTGNFVSGAKSELDGKIKKHGSLIAKWTVSFKTKNI